MPLASGIPERRAHDYVRHGSTELFAFLGTAMNDGEVTSTMQVRCKSIARKYARQ